MQKIGFSLRIFLRDKVDLHRRCIIRYVHSHTAKDLLVLYVMSVRAGLKSCPYLSFHNF